MKRIRVQHPADVTVYAGRAVRLGDMEMASDVVEARHSIETGVLARDVAQHKSGVPVYWQLATTHTDLDSGAIQDHLLQLHGLLIALDVSGYNV